MSLLFEHDPEYFALDHRQRMALLLMALELRYRFGCDAVYSSCPTPHEVQVNVPIDEDRFIWETNLERMEYWAHTSVLQSQLMTARYGFPIRVAFWATGLWEPLGSVRIDRMVSTPDPAPVMAPAGNVEDVAASQTGSKPGEADFHVAVGCALWVHGKNEFAKDQFRKAIMLDEKHANAWFHLGNTYYAENDFSQAMVYLRMAINLQPDHVMAWQSLGNALCSMQSMAAGMVCYIKVLELDPKAPGTHHNMGNALIALKKYVEAEARLREALTLEPLQEKTYNTLGNLYFAKQDYAAAAAHYQVCALMRPSYAAAHTNLGNALLSLHKTADAIQAYETGLTLDPTSAGVRYNLALAYLREGRWDEGWAAHEARWDFKELRIPKRKFTKPMWNGNQFGGKTLLVYSEQGLGDTIQFARYMDYVHSLAGVDGKIIFEVPDRLLRLMRFNYEIDGSVQVFKRGDALPDYDVRVPLMSMPRIFGTTVDTIPAPTRYIAPVGGLWTGQSQKRIGLSWSGNPKYKADKQRSIPAHFFAQLAMPQVQFVSLQLGHEKDVEMLSKHMPLEIPEKPSDFADTATIIEGLSLVITSDTAVAHLAAAMGKPVWLLLCYLADWRWLTREWKTSPWYPTMQLFRQTVEGDWGSVFWGVNHALENLDQLYDELLV